MESRIDRVLSALGEIGIEQMLITDPRSIYYLTGYNNYPHERFFAFLIRKDARPVMFLNNLFMPPVGVACDEVWFSDTDNATDLVEEYVDPDKILGVDKDIKARFLLPLIEDGAARGYVNSSIAVDMTRGIKDEEEREKMRVASAANDSAMAKLRELVHEGASEKEIADQLLQIYMDLGASGHAFDPIVSFGANAADPHHSPDDTVLKAGDVVLFDVGCKVNDYCSDMTRTFVYKEATELNTKIYELVRGANESAIAQIKPGVPIHVLDDTARGIISEAGYGEYFNHRLGHFIGLDGHEFGDVSAVNETLLQPGMIFSIEPGIYLPGQTGVRIEDLVLVTEGGCEVLNHYPKALEVIE